MGKVFLKMNWLSKPHGVHSSPPFALCQWPEGGLTSTPLKPLAKVREDNTLLPQQRRASEKTGNLAMYPPRYEMQMVAQEVHNLCKPKINKLKGGYSAMANLIFQSWLKDTRVHIEGWNLMEREAIQLVKDFTAECSHDKVEFYIDMIM